MAIPTFETVTNIAQDDSDLERRAQEMTGEHLHIDTEWIVGSVLLPLDEKIRAILIRTDGDEGAVRLTGAGIPNEVKDFETGQEKAEFILVTIQSGQKATIFGRPKIRLLRRP